MSAGGRNPELFDGEPDLRDDPDYLRYAAQLDGEADYERGITILEGWRARHYTDRDESDAYLYGWNRACLLDIAGKNLQRDRISVLEAF